MNDSRITDGKATDGMYALADAMGAGMGQTEYYASYLTRNRVQLELRYRTSPLAGMIVDAVAEDMMRAGIDFQSADFAPDDADKLNNALTRGGYNAAITKGLKWGRLYGGAIGVIDINGQDPSTPLRLDTVGKGQLHGLRIYDRWRLWTDIGKLVQGGTYDGKPEYYTLVQDSSLFPHSQKPDSGLPRIHHSRVIRFVGIELPYFQSIQEMLWGESVLERVNDALSSYDRALKGVDNLISLAYLRTVKLEDLRKTLATGGGIERNIAENFRLMERVQSAAGITLLDKSDDFQTNSYSFSGLSDAMMEFAHQISAASGIPLVRLFGQSPAGLNSTGESDLRLYYNTIHAQQESRLRDGMHRLIKVLYRSEFGKPEPDNMTFEFAPLWQMSAQDKATVATSVASVVNSCYESGIINQADALRELRRSSMDTGIFSHITEDSINEAERDPEVPLSQNVLKKNDLTQKNLPDLETPTSKINKD